MAAFLAALHAWASRRPFAVELMVVDDLGVGALDVLPASERVLMRRLPGDPRGGQDLAVLSGIRAAPAADLVVAMDPDMAGNIGDLDALLDAYAHGCELVYTWRRARGDTGCIRVLASRAYNRALRAWTGANLHDINTPMFLLSPAVRDYLREAAVDTQALKLSTFFAFSARFAEVPIDVPARGDRASNYGLLALAQLCVTRLVAIRRWWKTQARGGA